MRSLYVLPILLLAMLVPHGTAQEPEEDLVIVDVEVDETDISTAIGEPARFVLTIRDMSLDDPSRVDGAPSLQQNPHKVEFTATVLGEDTAFWQAFPPTQIPTMYAGDEHTRELLVRPGAGITTRTVAVNLTITTTGQFGEDVDYLMLRVETPGFDSLSAIATGGLGVLEPRQFAEGQVDVRNNGLFPRMFHMEVQDANDCGLTLIPSNDLAIGPKETVPMSFSVQAPADKPIYISQDCPIRVTISDASNPGIFQSTSVGATVNGTYLDPVWIFWALAIIVAAIILFILFARRKAIIEEELLGKPQRPWTIPVERVYLKHLEERDPRAAYVVRHFLMEEEYQSALLWYHSYKDATKGTRSKESLVVRQEKSYDRFQKKWERKIARPLKKADRFEAKLQKKLDRQAKKNVRKDRHKRKKLAKKLEAAHEKRFQKQLANWEKAVKKAEKKGLDAPSKPTAEPLDLPDKPTLQKIELSQHKWQKKADRKRARMLKKQGNLEVRYEKKDARRLAKVRRKVHKIAKKIDDPEFAEEHPLVD